MTYKLTNTSQPADPYYGAVSLLLHGDGADGSTQIIDSSPRTKTVTAVGNAQISTTESKFNGSSLKFDGTGDYLGLGVNNPDYAFGSGDFTVEGWVYPIDTSASVFFGGQSDLATKSGSSYGFFLYPSGDGTSLYIGSGNKSINSPNPPINQWSHVAFVRNGTNFTSFLNGTIVSTRADIGTSAVNVGSVTYQATIGAFPNGSNDFNGYIDDFRITKGVARYTSNFTPPTQPFQSLAA